MSVHALHKCYWFFSCAHGSLSVSGRMAPKKRSAPYNTRAAVRKRTKALEVNASSLLYLIPELIAWIFAYVCGTSNEWVCLRGVCKTFQSASWARQAQSSMSARSYRTCLYDRDNRERVQVIPNLTDLTLYSGGFGVKNLTFNCLQHLQLYRCAELTDRDVSAMASFGSLKSFTANWREQKISESPSTFTGSGFRDWSSHGNFRSVQMNRWQPKHFRHLGALRSLHSLGLWCCRPLTDTDIQALSKLTALTKLFMPYSDIADSAACALSSLSNLQQLDLSGSDCLTNAVIPALTSLKLKWLNLKYTEVSDPCIVHDAGARRGPSTRGSGRGPSRGGPCAQSHSDRVKPTLCAGDDLYEESEDDESEE